MVLIVRLILAVAAVAAVAARPSGWSSAAVAAACAGVALAAGLVPADSAGSAVVTALPPVVFIASVMGLALVGERDGLAARFAAALAAAGRGRTLGLFVWVCVACALLTAAVSLDGAVVMMAPVLAALARAHGAPLRPLLLASVGVANSFSAALPTGNPTNLVVMERLGLSPLAFSAHMLLPSLAAAVACATVLWALERKELSGGYKRVARAAATSGRLAGSAVAAAAVAAWAAPVVGLPPWVPVSVVAAGALVVARRRPLVALPLRTGVQIGSLLVLLESLTAGLGIGAVRLDAPSAAGLLALAVAVTACAALANNLPASAAVAALLGAGPGSYAALLGLSAGALATPHGSVATLVSLELSGYRDRLSLARTLATAAACAVIAGTAVLWLTAG